MTVAIIINAITLTLLVYSFKKSAGRTLKSLKIALTKGINLAPWMIGIIVLIGVILSFVPPSVIEQYLGGEMTVYQVGSAALIGTISMIPNLVAMPLAGSLIESGASYTTIAAFLTTLTMVGFVTLPLELKEMGRKITFWRNFLAFFFAVIIAIAIGILM
ncbi:permease [Halarsenatibacter silvermanii]|uniref:Predicted permease n=1 Tax=Halarsenatibacter silvermanii TaxID=321763 RepID=A0A1G9ICZ1_9FIRM|nr:permease [Halarsenatibacter silvermanii]SDL22976.1 Predicted permease [Halarsenatibacter silvermanii]